MQQAVGPADQPIDLLLLAAGDLAFHALDVEVHTAQKLVIGHRVFGQHFLAVLTHDRALPDLERPVGQALLHGFDLGLGVRRHVFGDGDYVYGAFLHAPPALARGPLAFQRVLGGLDVVRAPVDDVRSQVGLGTVGGHVAVPTEGALAL